MSSRAILLVMYFRNLKLTDLQVSLGTLLFKVYFLLFLVLDIELRSVDALATN